MTRVLVVDDSSFMRHALRQILESDAALEVVNVCGNGAEAVQAVKQLHPDVVLLDIEMPVMDGLTALAHIMAERPTPVVMISGLSRRNANLALQSLDAGAIDFIAKPSGVISYDIETISKNIVTKTKIAATADVGKFIYEGPQVQYRRAVAPRARKKMVVIGASTGGPRAVAKVLANLTGRVSAAIVVIQHLGADFVPSFIERLSGQCPLEVCAASNGQVVGQGQVLVAPTDYNLTFDPTPEATRISFRRLSCKSPLTSIDATMVSAARAYGAATVGVLLTGSGSDGARGMKAIKQAGGVTIAEDESTCVVCGMPRSAIELGCVDEVLPLSQIAPAILRLV